jgi:radical SAM protein with 4Fe4S-binding SPASM domain
MSSSLRYWRRLARLFVHYTRKSTYLPYLPIRLWVELSSHCNYRCIMCPNKDLPPKEKGHMDFDLYTKIIDEARGFVFDINLAHRGESLLHPRLVEAVQYAKRAGLYTRLHTNGSLLTEDLARQIVSSGLDRLSFSFDGYTEDTYEQIRLGGDFEKTTANIVRLLEIKKEQGSRTPETAIEVINFETLAAPELAEAKQRFRDRFRDLPLDSFTMKELHNWAGEIEQGDRGAKYSACPFPWNALIIFWDGAVYPCTQDFFGHYPVGDVTSSSLKEIWNSPALMDLRSKLAKQDISDIETCSRCDRPWRKRLLGVPKEYLWKFLTKRMP